jgi:uncharacterized protein YndB with AHSA1/START domain
MSKEKGKSTNYNPMKSTAATHEFVVSKTIAINARPSEVWDALTNPLKTRQYFFNCEVFSDWKTGSTITFRGKIFWVKKIELTGKIVKIQPEQILKYTLGNRGGSGPSSISTVTDELTYKNGVTTLSITDDVGKGEGAGSRFEKSNKAWDKVLKGLKEVVERED